MTQNEIIELARQAGFEPESPPENSQLFEFYEEWFEQMAAFAKLVAEKERERISQKIAQLPFGDTAQSFSIWVKNDT